MENIQASTALCQQDAEWIISTFQGDSQNQVPYANLGSVTFENALVLTGNAGIGGVGFLPAVTPFNLEAPNGQVLTSVSTTDSTITVSHL